MSLVRFTPDQVAAIKDDLRSFGVEGLALLAIAPFSRTADAHAYVREFFLAFLRSLFRSMPVGEFRWDVDDGKTEILVQYADPRDAAAKGKTPAVTLELTPFTWSNLVINNFLHEDDAGNRWFTDLRNGAAVVRCRSSVKLEADSLAAVVSAAFHYMHEDVERLSGCTYADAYTSNPSSGELTQSNPAGEMFVANVVVNIHLQETWKKTPGQSVKGKVVFNDDPQGILFE